MFKPFTHLKVVELASVLAGPSAGLFFAELGAKVLKIENKRAGGDVTRSWKLPSEDKNKKESAYFYSVNAGKKHLFLDLSDPKDHARCIKEISDADIVITNYKKGDDVKLKLSYKDLQKTNPGLIYASINGFGEDSSRTAYDLILQAESGFMAMNGEENSDPLKMPVALIDVLAAHQLKEAVLIALLKKQQTGKGSKISVSLFDSAVASLVNQATNWLVAGHLPKASGSLHPNIAPYGEIFKTKDKHLITFAIGSDKQFDHLLSILKLENTIDKKLFSNNQLRIKNRKKLYNILQTELAKHTFGKLFKLCMQHDVPIGKIRNMKEVFELEEGKKMLVKSNGVNTVKSVAFKIH
ncbi:MAG: CaiB/BaiF CoA-transferase family protein [Bacteroidota bacterium]|nr:CaiB/BaiF CoA-transferase family protein [Bacteroidota bacterium]